MSDGFSRRDFMKTAGVATGVGLAAGVSPFSYAQNEKIRVACIGTGGQGGFHIRHGIANSPDLQVVAVCDVLEGRLNAAWGAAGGEAGDVKMYMDYRKLLDEVEFDAAVIATPLYAHYHIAMDCLDAGKNVFLEKTMCYDIEQCRNLVTKCHETGRWVQVGHQRRYNPAYNKAVWLARGDETRSSVTGRLNHINAWWHRNNDWRRPVAKDYQLSDAEKQWIEDLEKHVNWRLYKERSRGGLVTELATHQLDVTNWFLGTPPARCTAYGGIDYWRDGREVNDNIVMVYEYDIDRDDDGFATIPPRNPEQRLTRINRPYTVRMTYSSICANARRSYGEHIQGDRGSFLTTEQKGVTFFAEPAAKDDWNANKDAEKLSDEDILQGKTRGYKEEAYTKGELLYMLDDVGQPFAWNEEKQIPTNGAAGSDPIQFRAFARDIREGTVPKSNQMVGLMAAVAGFAAIDSMEAGGSIDIDPAQYSFDFETPDPWRFDYFEDPNYAKDKAEEPAEEPPAETTEQA
jgi:predicted dehydrogenase